MLTRWNAWGMVACLAAAACGAEATSSSGAGASSTTGSSTTSSSAGGMTSSSTSTSSSSSTAGGAGGEGGGCPDISCSTPCPGDSWPELDGCPSCACAADLELVVNGFPRAVQHLTMSVVASEFIGGIDRWVFDFTWQYDDPMTSDDAEVVQATVRIMRLGPEHEPDEENVTYFSPADDGNPLELLQGEYTLYGIGTIMSTLEPAGGFFSIRRVGNNFEGHVSLDFTTSTTPSTLHAAGPFTVAVP